MKISRIDLDVVLGSASDDTDAKDLLVKEKKKVRKFRDETKPRHLRRKDVKEGWRMQRAFRHGELEDLASKRHRSGDRDDEERDRPHERGHWD